MKFFTKYLLAGLFAAAVATVITGCGSVPKPREWTPEELALRAKAEAVFKPARTAYMSAKTVSAREKSLEKVRESAIDVYPEAMYFYGFHFFMLKDPSKDEKKVAADWISKAANAGYAPAMTTMAFLYMDGFGVFRSTGKAYDLFSAAAGLGDSVAMYNLGLMYLRGVGVRQNDVVAAEWFKKGAEKGDVRSWVYLGNLYLRGKGVFKSYSKAERCFMKAVEQGDGEAMMLIGLMCKNGIGRDKDLIKAQEWYEKAIEAGYQPAQERVDDLESERSF